MYSTNRVTIAIPGYRGRHAGSMVSRAHSTWWSVPRKGHEGLQFPAERIAHLTKCTDQSQGGKWCVSSRAHIEPLAKDSGDDHDKAPIPTKRILNYFYEIPGVVRYFCVRGMRLCIFGHS